MRSYNKSYQTGIAKGFWRNQFGDVQKMEDMSTSHIRRCLKVTEPRRLVDAVDSNKYLELKEELWKRGRL
jgi:hypothetical protein